MLSLTMSVPFSKPTRSLSQVQYCTCGLLHSDAHLPASRSPGPHTVTRHCCHGGGATGGREPDDDGGRRRVVVHGRPELSRSDSAARKPGCWFRSVGPWIAGAEMVCNAFGSTTFCGSDAPYASSRPEPDESFVNVAMVVVATCDMLGFLLAKPRTFRNQFIRNKLHPETSDQGFIDSFRCRRETFHRMFALVSGARAWRKFAKRRKRKHGIAAVELFVAVF